MSDEEKKAIEIIKFLQYKCIEENETGMMPIYRIDDLANAIKILLNLIEKQSKEIEELKKPKYFINCKTNEITKLTNDFVSKDKIREFIKNELPDDEIMKCCNNYDVNGVMLRKELQKLLEGE